MSQLTIRYFAAAAEAAGINEEQWDLSPTHTLAELRTELVERHGSAMARVLRTGSFLIDGTVRRDAGVINGAVVDVLPPFAGG